MSVRALIYYVSRIIKTYTVNNEHAIKNSKDFVEKIKDVRVNEDQQMTSFDIVALYPSLPQDQALVIFEEHLLSDEELKIKTPIPPRELMALFRNCLKRTYFVFNAKLYVRVYG